MEIDMADMNETGILEEEMLNDPLVQIEAGKECVSNSYSVCKACAKSLKDEYKVYCATAKKAQSNPKTYKARLDSAERRFKEAKIEYGKALFDYNKNIDIVLDEYRLLAEQGGKESKKAHKEAERYVESQDRLLDKLTAFVSEIELESDEDISEKSIYAQDSFSEGEQIQSSETNVANPYYYVPVPQPQINVAPVNIDITPIVEDAVSSALEKFKDSFDRRASDYIASMAEKLPQAAHNAAEGGIDAPVSQLTVGIAENSAEDQAYITEKLTEVAQNVKDLLSSITELSVAYVELAERQKEAIALQRQINDTHRALTREIEGLQINQKVIGQEQAAIAEEQTVVIEQQRAAAAKQKLIMDSQDNITELQRTAMDAQSILEGAIKDVLQSQKEIISSHQSIINGVNKTREIQMELSSKQADLTELQRNALTEQKLLLKSQRTMNEKIRSRIEKTAPASKKREAHTVVDSVELPQEK